MGSEAGGGQVDAAKTVAVIGASRDRAKFGNRAVRAFRAEGWTVYPVNPRQTEIEGLRTYASITDIPGVVRRVVLYVQPFLVLSLLDDIARKGVEDITFNPGTESEAAIARARALGLRTHIECAIVAIGRNPSHPD